MFIHQLKNELWKLYGKKRTYIGFTMFLLAQLAIILMFRYSPARNTLIRAIEHNGFDAKPFISMLTISATMVFLIAIMLLPLYVALVGGDLVSKEAEDGTLRMILSRPVSRVRLLFVKWLAGFVFSCSLVVALGFFGLLFCSIWFPPTGKLFVMVPDEALGMYDFADGLRHYALAHVVMMAKAVTIMSLAFMFSCFNMKPAGATIMAISLILIDWIMMQIPYFHDLKYCFLGHYLGVWQIMFVEPVAWWRVGQALSIMAGASVTFFIIGLTVFHARDIKS